ncbi:hypothetical protein GGR53DRAFT_261179 [Hypoxylon sp. FL1150]|nr:hypothetical protein GGR53DRAFT_261179 [Hypoxylon sp. FL1150]
MRDMAATRTPRENLRHANNRVANDAQLHFIVSTDIEKPNPNLRKFIRSHVMLGKNRGKTRSVEKKRQRATEDVPVVTPHTSTVDTLNPNEQSISSAVASTTASQPILPLTIPRKFGSDISSMSFPDAVEPRTVEVVLKFSSIAKQILFPLEPCVFFERRAQTWVEPLTFDPVFLHTMIFTSQSYFDVVATGRTLAATKVALHHFVKALKLLRERISRDDTHVTLSDNTLAAIMAFAGHALLTGDYKLAMNHVEGLRKIVSLRGGVSTFKSNPKLLIEILRCDIGMVLHRGSKPVFFNQTTPGEPFMPYPDLTPLLELRGTSTMASQNRTVVLLNDINGELSGAWNTMSAFCSVANFAVESGQYISINTYLETMASVVYRLFNMHFEPSSIKEAVRLGLLAFSTSVFLQWGQLGLSYTHLTSEFMGCLVKLVQPCASPQLMVWLMMVGAVSVLNIVDDVWLKSLLAANMGLSDIQSWDEMQDLLNQFMWVRLVHDKAAKRVFDRLSSSTVG